MRFLKNCNKSICRSLEIIFRDSIDQAIFPDQWKKDTVAFTKQKKGSAPRGLSSSHFRLVLNLCTWPEEDWRTLERWCTGEGADAVNWPTPTDLSLFNAVQNQEPSEHTTKLVDHMRDPKGCPITCVRRDLHNDRCNAPHENTSN